MRHGLRVRLGAFLLVSALWVALAAWGPGPSAAVPLEAFAINPAWVPSNTAPASAPATIRGIGFTPTTTVAFDGVAAAVTFVDSRTLQVLVPTSATGKVANIVVSDGSQSDRIYPFLYTDSICYVRTTGNDASDCETTAGAVRTLTAALTKIMGTGFPGSFPEVRVAGGVYNESQIAIQSSVVVAGGWNDAFTQRQPDQLVTVIDAGRAGFALRTLGLDTKQVLDNVTVRNGVRDGLGGGGFIISGDNAVITNSVFVGNTSSARGGGIYATFSAAYGGRPIISKNVLLGNRSFSATAGGGIGIYPIYTQGQVIDFAISDNYILGNRSFTNRGGGIGLGTAATYAYNTMKISVVGNVIGGNRSASGAGAAFLVQSGSDHLDLEFDNNLLFGNISNGEGGGLLITGVGRVTGRVSGNTFAGNTAGVDGGGGIKFSPGPVYEPAFQVRNLISWGNANGNLSGLALAGFSDIGGGSAGTGNIASDPRFRAGPMGAFYLAQDANGISPAVDSGAGSAADFAQDSLTTALTLSPDTGMVDMGFHYPVGVGPSANPITVGRVDPQTGDHGGADWVLIRGTGFDPGATATFGGVPATDSLFISDTRLLAQPASHAFGLVNVVVTNPDLTTATLVNGYQYADNLPPEWPTTTGLQQILSQQDCVRSAVLTWNPAVDAATAPVKYSIYREVCVPTVNDFRNPCTNTGYFPGASNFVTTTTENFYVDTNFGSGGADPKYIYLVRAADSATPVPNNEFNYSKRIVVVGKVTGDTTPPSSVGNTLDVPTSTLLDWTGATGAVSYRVYRQTSASSYGTPASLTPLITLTTANNDLDLNGVTDTRYTDPTLPAAGSIFFYKITALDACNVESRSELGP